MKKEELVRLLRKFGLTEYEAKVYVALNLLGPSKISSLSKESHIPKSKIYSVLESLMRKQLVEFLGGRPKEFKAIPPKAALNNLIEMKKAEIKELEGAVELLDKNLKPITQEIIEGVWTTSGKGLKEFINRLCEMFDRAEKYAYVISRDFTWSSKLAKSVKSAVRRGVSIRTIAMKGIDESNYYRAKWFASYGVKIRIFKTKAHPRIIVMDGKEVLIRLDKNPTKPKAFPFISIYSTDPSLAKIFDFYMKSLWERAEPVNFEKIALALGK